jgi:hypothetical protein
MLWKLNPIKPWEPWYDCMFAIVVRAGSEDEARRLAVTEAGSEGEDVWTDPSKTVCERVWPDGGSEVICRDFARA